MRDSFCNYNLKGSAPRGAEILQIDTNLTDKLSDLDDLNRFERFLCEADLKKQINNKCK
jgi:hypothetical protein